MPYIQYGDTKSVASRRRGVPREFSSSFDYTYPKDLNLKPGSELHEDIIDRIMERAYESSALMTNRFDSWNSIDKMLTTYVDLTEEEEDEKDDDYTAPVTIVYPDLYAVLESLLSYLTSVLMQDPIFMYEGVSPEDTIGAIMLEKVIDLHAYKSKVILNLHTMLRDAMSYGFGIVAPFWEKKMGQILVQKKVFGLFSSKNSRQLKESVIFEGNALSNIDPYLALPDPGVPISKLQDGEFFGWVEQTNYLDLLSEEENDREMFNVRYLEEIKDRRTSIYTSDPSERSKKAGNPRLSDFGGVTSPTDVVNMFIKIIPKEWKLGDSEYPEKWAFKIGADAILLKAKPIGLIHGMYPVASCAPDFDGYSPTPVSRLEVLYGLQESRNWLFNAHMRNVKKAVNDTIIYDPYLLNTNDLKKRKDGGLVRLRRPAFGRGVKDVYSQLVVNDVTRAHIGDAEIIRDTIERVAGVDAASMGTLRSGGPERLTSKEFLGTRSSAYTRLERLARIIGVQAMQDIGMMFAAHTQQFMSQELYVTTTGRWGETIFNEFLNNPSLGSQVNWNGYLGDQGKFKVSPFDILVGYDIKVRDGTMPQNSYSEILVKMFEIVSNNQELLQQFDVSKLFLHLIRTAGVKNADSFLRVKVMPQQQVEQQVQQGNMIPTQQFMQGGE